MSERELPSEEELQQLQAEMDQARANACMGVIKEALETHRCILKYQEIRVNGELVRGDWVVSTRPKTPQG